MKKELEPIVFGWAIRDLPDERDYKFERTLWSGEIFSQKEWEEGYDVEKELNIKLAPNNQYTSSSCVGQAWSKYIAVLNFIETWVFDEVSAKAIYSQISLGYWRGAYLRDGWKLAKEWGSLFEKVLKSYKDNGSTDETFMMDKSWKNKGLDEKAVTLKAKDYYSIGWIGVDIFARAIKDGHWMVSGVEGTNNGTWMNVYPVPPATSTPQNQLWGHAVYFGKVRIKDWKKQVWFLNSWWNIGENGWQWLWEEWFENSGRWIFNPWILIDRPNNEDMTNIEFLKETSKPHIYMVNKSLKTKTMLVDMPTLNAFGEPFKEVENLNEYTTNGTMVWVNRIID